MSDKLQFVDVHRIAPLANESRQTEVCRTLEATASEV
jgi:hypothetical protein